MIYDKATLNRSELDMLEDGQYALVWTFNNKIWSESRLVEDGEHYYYNTEEDEWELIRFEVSDVLFQVYSIPQEEVQCH